MIEARKQAGTALIGIFHDDDVRAPAWPTASSTSPPFPPRKDAAA